MFNSNDSGLCVPNNFGYIANCCRYNTCNFKYSLCCNKGAGCGCITNCLNCCLNYGCTCQRKNS